MNIIDILDQEEAERVKALKTAKGEGANYKVDPAIPTFDVGDTLRVNMIVVEGSRERVQAYEGVCIARHNNGSGSSFTVRKISNG